MEEVSLVVMEQEVSPKREQKESEGEKSEGQPDVQQSSHRNWRRKRQKSPTSYPQVSCKLCTKIAAIILVSWLLQCWDPGATARKQRARLPGGE